MATRKVGILLPPYIPPMLMSQRRSPKYLLRHSYICIWCAVALLAIFANGSHAWADATDDKPKKPAQEERVYLIHADHLRYDQMKYPGAQRLSGKVKFSHAGMTLSCDSAVLYEITNSFEATGHVVMTQGDTLSLTGDSLYYTGSTQIAEVRRNVRLRHRNQILLTDTLNYERMTGKGYYINGGELIDGDNHLTSEEGEYYTTTRKATFQNDVRLKNPKFTLTTNTLHYDTRTKWAHVVGPSNIENDNNRIYTEDGYYNSQTEKVRLYSSSTLYDRKRNCTMTGDSIFYNKQEGIMEAFQNIVYDDRANKNRMYGDYCRYNENTGEAIAYGRALAKDFSQSDDTLFVHADTIRMFTYNIRTDSVYRVMHANPHVRSYRSDVQMVCDSLVANSRLKRMDLYRDPIVWSDNRQILGEEINVFSNDSTLDSIYVQRQALMVERLDSTHYNQVASNLMRSFFDEKGEIYQNNADGNVCVIFYPLEKDSVILYQNYMETAAMRLYLEDRKLKKIWTTAAQGELYPLGLAPQDRTYLPAFAWFDYIRPRDKHDLFEWRSKKSGSELKASIRREPPVKKLGKKK